MFKLFVTNLNDSSGQSFSSIFKRPQMYTVNATFRSGKIG
jgi:hypothetical protein